ncbi:Latrophilin-3 [Wickerhamomyces ciferrii]|uniref:Latrophilin-3 n=1 Tax=Wickerhamomyces ciferrii (strain ATCC 14091 / BCRC 22168 / CBS 111 / JCM 3599 / NBRC 0793 / NRRL Y-1031 F-60-10) TaxID=1206466 RepID=K0KSV2_WICCF|nr:Latrophilin-3 [Wickerhamomyces ciferrii]CCH44413.1 Latrophilin-3 [Wickerhamomyces ciferrii]
MTILDNIHIAATQAYKEKHKAGMRYSPETFSHYQLDVLRVICIVSSSISILSCFCTFYTYGAIHPKRKKFRHQLIFFLIIFDFLKALSILLYPILSMVRKTTQIGPKTINFLGFFTALSIEGGDLAILSFAVHTLLLIFYPQRTGGLYFIRYYVYVFSVLGPTILACLAFINEVGYVELDIWCYMPERPTWYRMVLSWAPRYAIMLAILIIYSTIYFYIMKQLKSLEDQQRTMNNSNATEFNLQTGFQLDNEEKLKTRYKIIARQTKFIFLYPLAYFILWILPLVGNSLRLDLKSNYGLSVLISFMQPFNGTIDTLVYLYREKPWTLTYSNTPKSPFASEEHISKWRTYLSWLPLYKIPSEESRRNQTFDENLQKNINMVNALNPEEFLRKDSIIDDLEKHQGGENSSNSTATNINLRSMDFNNHDYSEHDHDHSNIQSNNSESDDEIDMLDFLNKGPQ